MAPRQGGGDGWVEQRVRGLLERWEGEGNDGARGGTSDEVVGGGEEGGDLEC